MEKSGKELRKSDGGRKEKDIKIRDRIEAKKCETSNGMLLKKWKSLIEFFQRKTYRDSGNGKQKRRKLNGEKRIISIISKF